MLPEESVDKHVLDQLAPYLDHLPEPVRLVMWGDGMMSSGEEETVRLVSSLSERFPMLHHAIRPRRINYHYYPVLGVMGLEGEEELDYQVRFIGQPAGYLINGLVGAIQAVSFRAGNLEARTRIMLSRLQDSVNLELLTAAKNEAGAIMATLLSGLAVASPDVHAFVVMADVFPQAAIRYSVRNMPHTVINRRYHVEGVVDEEAMLSHVARALKQSQGAQMQD